MIKIGCSSKDITPHEIMDMAGFIARQQPMLGIHDPLRVNAMVLESDHKKCAIISCDILSFSYPIIHIIRDRITENTGISSDSILISTTHTHSGPITSFMSLKKEPDSTQILPDNPSCYLRRKHLGNVNPNYLKNMIDTIVTAVVQANTPENMEELSEIAYYQDYIDGISIDRRATVGKKGKHGPLVTKEGDVDNSLHFILLKNLNHHIKAVLVNFACHPVVKDYTNRYISADFPGVVRRQLTDYFIGTGQSTKDLEILYLNGACGNINPVIMGGNWNELENFGYTITDKIIHRSQLAPNIQITDKQTYLTSRSKTVNLPLRVLTLEEIQAIHQKDLQEINNIQDRNSTQFKILEACLEWGYDTLQIVQSGEFCNLRKMEIQVIDLSIAKIVALSGEIFSKIGKNIKEQLGGNVILVGYANGNSGYIPTSEALSEGGYETDQAYRLFSTFPFNKQVQEIVERESINLGKSNGFQIQKSEKDVYE